MNSIRILCILMGAVCILLFIPPLLMYRILNLGNATGLSVGVVLIVYGIFMGAVHKGIAAMWKYVPGKLLLCIVGLGIILCIFLVLAISFCMLRAIHTKPVGDETLIVLGCQVKGTKPSLMLEERLIAAKNYLDANEDAMCILSGGKGDDEGISEALCMYNYLSEHGVSGERLIMEDRSTSTRENLQFSMNIMEERGLGTGVAIVTNEFHEYRAFKVAEKLGVRSSAIPAHTHWWLFPTYLVREWYGVIYEWTGMEH